MKTGKKYPFLFLLPYLLVFTVFIILPICVAVVLSFTDFNTVQMPNFVGFNNYINLATQDSIFMPDDGADSGKRAGSAVSQYGELFRI